MSQCDYRFKYILVGNSGVGKSCLLLRFTDQRFHTGTEMTIGVEFGKRLVRVTPASGRAGTTGTSFMGLDRDQSRKPSAADGDDTKRLERDPTGKTADGRDDVLVCLKLWDAAGSEAFRSITRSYYRGSTVAVLVYDVTERSTFLELSQWLRDIREAAHPSIVIALVGNKSDLAARRQVATADGEQFARDNDLALFIETSARTGLNVDEAFVRSAQVVCGRLASGFPYDVLREAEHGIKRCRQTGRRDVRLLHEPTQRSRRLCCQRG